MSDKKVAAKRTAPKAPKAAPADPSANPAMVEPVITAKAARKVPMFIASIVHLPGESKGGKHAPKVIKGGVLLDELKEKLTDDEIDELIALKAIRPATSAEIAAADARADESEAE